MSQFLASGGQSIGASASASVLPMNIQYSGLISFSNAQLWSKNLNIKRVWPGLLTLLQLTRPLKVRVGITPTHSYQQRIPSAKTFKILLESSPPHMAPSSGTKLCQTPCTHTSIPKHKNHICKNLGEYIPNC